jgi:tyrosine decarboxylase/aspartate 1-decarboxylase
MDFPQKGLSREIVHEQLSDFQKKSSPVDKIMTGEYQMTGLPDLEEIARDAIYLYMHSNSLFPAEVGVQQMAREVISMIGTLWGLDDDAKGVITAGGSESNIIALYAARNRSGGKRGSVVLPTTVHPSLLKGCYLLGLEPILVQVRDDFTADAEKMASAVRKDTIAIVATCGTFPWGTIDPVEEVGKIAEENSLYFHVDAAWGGLICPWLREVGHDIPEFGFKVKGVSSVSGDPHKQGFAIIPSGAIVFRDEDLLNLARWTSLEAGFTYSTLGILGTRPGSTVAVTWALFNLLGKEKYISLSKKCMDVTLGFVEGVQDIPGLSSATTPKINLANAISTAFNIDPVKKALSDRGWLFYATSGKPLTRLDAIVLSFLPYHEKMLPMLLKDIREIVSRVNASAAPIPKAA